MANEKNKEIQKQNKEMLEYIKRMNDKLLKSDAENKKLKEAEAENIKLKEMEAENKKLKEIIECLELENSSLKIEVEESISNIPAEQMQK